MALVSDLIQVGFLARQSELLGDEFTSYAAAGTTVSDATPITTSIVYILTTSGANAGLVLPKIDASKSKEYYIGSGVGSTSRIYVNDSAIEGIKIFGPAGGTAAYVALVGQAWLLIKKITADTWGAFTYT